jgi:hypothetical protein
MSIFTRKYIAIIDSALRLNGTSSSFQFKIDLPNQNTYNRVILLTAVIPKSYYMVSVGNNTFQINENNVLRTVPIPVGNYTLSAFQTAIILAMNTNTTFVYSVAYSSLTSKFTFTVTSFTGFIPQLVFTSNLFECFGFSKNSTNTFILTTSCTLVSTAMINLNPYEVLYIRSDMTANSFGTILDIVPMCLAPNYSFVSYQNTSDHTMRELVGNQNTIFTFTITDNQNRIVDLNGKDITMTLCIHHDTQELTSDVLRESLLIKNQSNILKTSEGIASTINSGTLDESMYTVSLT